MKKSLIVSIVAAVVLVTGICLAQSEKPAGSLNTGKALENAQKKRLAPAMTNRPSNASRNSQYARFSLIRGLQPTEDGGVVVIVADKLIKYDKDLNKVKEVTIELPELPVSMTTSGNCSSSCPGGTCGKKTAEEKPKE